MRSSLGYHFDFCCCLLCCPCFTCYFCILKPMFPTLFTSLEIAELIITNGMLSSFELDKRFEIGNCWAYINSDTRKKLKNILANKIYNSLIERKNNTGFTITDLTKNEIEYITCQIIWFIKNSIMQYDVKYDEMDEKYYSDNKYKFSILQLEKDILSGWKEPNYLGSGSNTLSNQER